MSRTLEVFRFELAYQAARLSTRIYFALFVGLSLAMSFIFLQDARNDGYFFNAPIITSAVTIIASMIALLVVAAVAGDAATRDAQTRIDSLLYTTPLRKAAYLGGRLFGAFVVTATLLVAVPIVLIAFTKMPGIEPVIFGPFRAEAYLTSYFFFAVPNAFVATAILFAVAAVTRRAIAAYGGAVFLFLSAFISEGFVGKRLGEWGLGKLLDPMGYTTLLTMWRSSNPLQKNTLLVGLDGALLSNRLFWLALAFGTFLLAAWRFRFTYATGGGRTTASDETIPWTAITGLRSSSSRSGSIVARAGVPGTATSIVCEPDRMRCRWRYSTLPSASKRATSMASSIGTGRSLPLGSAFSFCASICRATLPDGCTVIDVMRRSQ